MVLFSFLCHLWFSLGLVLMALFPVRSPVLGVGFCPWFSPFFYVFVSEAQCFDIVLLILSSDSSSFCSVQEYKCVLRET